MANLTVTVFNAVFDNAQIPPRSLSAPVAVDMTRGTPVKYNATSGKFEKMASTDAVQLFAGLITKDVKAGYVGIAFRGLAYMDGVTALGFNSLVTLGAAGILTDTQAAAKAIGRIVPMHETGGTTKKMIEIFEIPLTIA